MLSSSEAINMQPLLEVVDLKKYYPVRTGFLSGELKGKVVHAVDGISFKVEACETLGLVGESGCGKTTALQVMCRLIEPTSGAVYFDGKNVFHLDDRGLKDLRREMKLVFQDPYASLNPRRTVGNTLSRQFTIRGMSNSEAREESLRLLEAVGLSPAEDFFERHPHELSGGQRQRVAVARALGFRPRLIFADEPVSALDMSVRGQILGLLKNLQKSNELTYIFVTHDLGVVRSICTKIAVMYLGRIIEFAEVDDLFSHPQHPYTKAIISSTPIPNPDTRDREQLVLAGEVPSPIDLPPGCRFSARCPFKQNDCIMKEPDLQEIKRDHHVACYHPLT
jgi:oligopeptide/dipeptide ABC transporter ATP-binding protein